jgi:ABC-type multidrug transport system ATPase subunit
MDSEARHSVEAILDRFAAGRTQTLIFSSHAPELVRRLASRVICLQDGRVRADVSREEYLQRAVTESPESSLESKAR